MKSHLSTNHVKYYTFDNFEKAGGVKHCFTTKVGGASSGVFESMNLGFSRGDKDDNVFMNFVRLCTALDVPISSLVLSDQKHTAKIMSVRTADRGKGILFEKDYRNIDGLVTNDKNVALTTFYADCVPVYLYDPVLEVIALAHAGWKGTLAKIGFQAVHAMKMKYGCLPANILAGIGPSIGPCCFEVGEDLAVKFLTELPFCEKYISSVPGKKDKRILDLWGINEQILINAGILPVNIETAGLCTKCNGEDFFSHRATGDKRGSMAAVLMMS